MNKNCVHIDKLEQPFVYDEEVIDNILRNENSGLVRISSNIVLIRSMIEPNFKHCFKVNLETEAETITLGYLYWGSNNKWLNSIYFKVFNKRLYDNSNVKINDIGETLGLKVNRLPNIDIAMDFNFNVIDRIYELFRKKNIETIILNRVIEKDEYVDELLNLGKGTLINPYKFKGFYIKGKDSHRLELNAYDKSLEIEKSSHKEYIKETEGYAHIYRLEVRVVGNQLYKTLKSLGISCNDFLTSIYEPAMLIKVWEKIFDRLLRFRTYGRRECERTLDLLMQDNDKQLDAIKTPQKRSRKRILRRNRYTSVI